MKKRVAIQGWRGAFHHSAAEYYFGKDIELVECEKFTDLFKALKNKKADVAVMAIENSVAGSIRDNFTLLRRAGFPVTGEVMLRIEQNLMALPGQKIENLKEIHSHPMAIAQCTDFFDEYPAISLVEAADTALCAKEIAQKKLINQGTIASKLAAEIYGLEILAPSIENHKNNFTRFLIIEKEKSEDCKPNKASMWFTLPHKSGSLSKILTIAAFHGINLSKIESLPILGERWVYEFYIDFLFDNYVDYQNTIDAIRPFTQQMQVLGVYEEGKEYFTLEKEIPELTEFME